MSNNTELIDKESLDKIVADIKAILKRTSLDALNSVQWEFNQRYLFGNDADKPLIKAGKLFTKEGPVAKGAIWTSLDTGKLWMNTGSGWKNIGGLNNINKPDLIEVFHPRTDYPVEETVSVTDLGGEQWIPYPFKKYERYAVTKSQSPFTCFLCRAAARDNITQDIRTLFGSAASTNQFTCMVDDAKYFGFTTGSSSNLVNIDIVDLGSALEPIKDSNMQAGWHIYPFPIEKGKTYYWTKTALSIWFGYGDRKNDTEWIEGTQVQVHYGGDSGAGTWSFKAEKDATGVGVLIGANTVLESFEFKGEDLPDYKLTYPHVVKSGESFPAEPKIGDMVFDSSALKKIPKWWNGTSWITANGDSNPLQGKSSGHTYFGENSSIQYEVGSFGIVGGALEVMLGNELEYIKSIATFPIMENLMSSASAPNYLASIKVVKDYVTAKMFDFLKPQIVTFTNYSGETITAEDKPKIIISYSYGTNSILDFTNITKDEGKEIELIITCGNTLTIKDGNTNMDLNGCNESVVKCICLNNQWTFFKTSGITQITSEQ